MLSNNAERLNIVLNQSNRFDYHEFVKTCESKGIKPLILGDWASKVGMVCAAIVMFPDDAPPEAYTKFVHLRNNSLGASTGLGDTIAKITKNTGLDNLAKIYTQLTGRDCGCSNRQDALNKLIPYGLTEIE